MSRESVTGVVAEGEIFIDTSWAEVVDAEFHGCTFAGADLHEAEVRGSKFVDCRFERCDLSLWRPVDSVFGGSRFEDCRMLGIEWTLAVWPRVPLHEPNEFVRCDLSMGTFANLDLGAVTFGECRLREVSYRETRMPGARFDGSDCLGADFYGADLTEAGLIGVDGLALDPRDTKLEGAGVDGATGAAILEMLGINLMVTGLEELPGSGQVLR
jgi:uncharacterized protein YjbI with pentapeptide repeats